MPCLHKNNQATHTMEINLTDRFKEVVGKAIVSVEDYEKVNKHSWHAWRKDGKITYAKTVIDKKPILMHQFILGKPGKGNVVDHKNNNGLDNRRDNLQIVTYSANNQNRVKRKSTRSRYIGVKPCRGSFAVDHAGIRLGTFKCEEEAARHYDKYVTIKYKNASPKTNFVVAFDEVDGVTLEDLVLKERKVDDLPLNISYNPKTQRYVARKMHNGKLHVSSSVKTLDQAKKELNKINSDIQNALNHHIQEHYDKPIARNNDHNAVILIKGCNEQYVECIVDDEFWHELTLYNWWLNGRYAWTTFNSTPTSMQSLLMNKTFTKGCIIDHINNNPLDNRLSNLRYVEPSVNCHNKQKKSGCTSRYIGVCKKGNKWVANISHNNLPRYLGSFPTELDAAKEYNRVAVLLYGDNANLNNINID